MRPNPLAILVLLAPLAAGAQTTDTNTSTTDSKLSISLTSGSLTLGSTACTSNTSNVFTATYASPVPTNATLSIFLQDSSTCATTAPSTAESRQLSEANRSVILKVATQDVAGSSCPTTTTPVKKTVCALLTVSTSTTAPTTFLTLTYDSAPPPVPTLDGAVGGDGSVHLHWVESDSNYDHMIVHYRQLTPGDSSSVDPCNPPAPVPFDAGTSDAASAADAGSQDTGSQADGGADASVADAGTPVFNAADFPFTKTFKSKSGDVVDGLSNGATYQFYIEAVDDSGNTSGQSNGLTATPELVHDFYRRYRCEGGQEQGGFGCATAGAALVPAFGALAAALLLRRRRSHP